MVRFNFLECMHLVRELAIFWARKDKFITFYDSTHGVVPVILGSCRIGVHKCNGNLTSSIHISKARIVSCFDSVCHKQLILYPKSVQVHYFDLSNLAIEVIPHTNQPQVFEI